MFKKNLKNVKKNISKTDTCDLTLLHEETHKVVSFTITGPERFMCKSKSDRTCIRVRGKINGLKKMSLFETFFITNYSYQLNFYSKYIIKIHLKCDHD